MYQPKYGCAEPITTPVETLAQAIQMLWDMRIVFGIFFIIGLFAILLGVIGRYWPKKEKDGKQFSKEK
jgi:hypothetical protein